MSGTENLIPLSEIDIPPDRARALDKEWCAGLAKMIKARGLYQPVLVRPVGDRFRLVAGMHRLAALRRLRWAEIPCRISTAETDADARLDEVMKNLVRQELSALDRCRHLWELKQAWEEKHPQSAHGKASRQKRRKAGSDPRKSVAQKEVFGFAKANAEALWMSQRTIRRAVAIWEGLAPDVREQLVGTPLARKQTELKALSVLSVKQQLAVVELILTNDDVRNVAGALLALDRGALPSPIEKRLRSLHKQLDELPAPVFERMVLEREEKILAALAKHGRL